MKILLADDHAMVRAGLGLLLSRLFQGVTIIEAGDYTAALASCREHRDLALILVDRVMPGTDGGRGMRALCNERRDVPVVVLSASEDPEHVQEALDAGARGYMPKSTSEPIMFSALQLVLAGGTYLPTTLLERMHSTAVVMRGESTQSVLTPRQLDILAQLAIGKTNKDIARALEISPATVQTHIIAIFRVLNVSNRTRAVHVAGQMGLLPVNGD